MLRRSSSINLENIFSCTLMQCSHTKWATAKLFFWLCSLLGHSNTSSNYDQKYLSRYFSCPAARKSKILSSVYGAIFFSLKSFNKYRIMKSQSQFEIQEWKNIMYLENFLFSRSFGALLAIRWWSSSFLRNCRKFEYREFHSTVKNVNGKIDWMKAIKSLKDWGVCCVSNLQWMCGAGEWKKK